MCGIAGIVNLLKHDLEITKYIKSMTKKLKHRGPDDEGYLLVNKKGEFLVAGGEDTCSDIWNYKIEYAPNSHINNVKGKWYLTLAHRRLSILDLSLLGHQPMSYDSENLWIVFNGEIYNYVEIRKELQLKGYCFSTNTDTEVILVSYKEWGYECLNRFNGMWAFVIYDKKRNILFGSRDRFGVKPLYYFYKNGIFVFASEIKAFINLPFIPRRINEKILWDYLVLGLVEHLDETFFEDIYKLPHSHYFILNLNTGNFQIKRYYKLTFNLDLGKFKQSEFEKYKKKIRELIFNAINLRLRSDVPVGSCLSGGLDSSTIVCVINEILKKQGLKQIGDKQKVFSARYNNEQIDESFYMKEVVKKTNVEWHFVYPTAESLLNDMEDLIYYQDEPFGSTSIYAQYCVMRLAKEKGIKVLLDGQGGDELFGGYLWYYFSFLREIMIRFKFKHFFGEIFSIKTLSINFHTLIQEIFFRTIFKIQFEKLKINGIFKSNHYYDIISCDFFEEYKERYNYFIEKIINSSLNVHLAKEMEGFVFEPFVRNLQGLLKYEDRNSMRFSIEARTPFSEDINLIEFLFEIPSVYKIKYGINKFLLREAMEDILPLKIYLRKDKKGFPVPQRDWFLKNIKKIERLFQCYKGSYLNSEFVIENLYKMININSPFLWRCINLVIWENLGM